MKCESVTKVVQSPIPIERFKEILPQICDKETSYDAKGWTAKNPLYSHCTPVSLIAQNLFGGRLLCASLKESQKYKHMKSHYWNKLPDGIEIDFTKPQFEDDYPNGLPWVKKEPEHTCLRCTTQMHNAGIRTVFVPVKDRWIGISTEEALKTALAYATKEKKV